MPQFDWLVLPTPVNPFPARKGKIAALPNIKDVEESVGGRSECLQIRHPLPRSPCSGKLRLSGYFGSDIVRTCLLVGRCSRWGETSYS
ncbi:hypothetical protein FKM82_018080 [Ascaphus truei]